MELKHDFLLYSRNHSSMNRMVNWVYRKTYLSLIYIQWKIMLHFHGTHLLHIRPVLVGNLFQFHRPHLILDTASFCRYCHYSGVRGIVAFCSTVGFGYKKFGYKKVSDIRKFHVESYDNKHYLNFGYKKVIQNCSSILYESNSRLYSTHFIYHH